MAAAGSPAAPPAIVFLLPVWGERFVTQFLELGLRTLLAPGNVPAVADGCDCTFRFLTTSSQEPQLRGHPMVERLSRRCGVEVVHIDDIVFPGVHSLTITLAYVRGMRASGAAMTRTHFVFLVADYVMADGSLRHLLRLIRDGASGVTTGNFQIVKEEAEPIIEALVSDPSAPLSVTPRALLRIAFEHLHPVVTASMPAAGEHTILCNRLFWQAGAGTLVARFYLRHMLCIRPETDAFDIGASSDYAFIPEMCPSGRVVAITDSDDYCVVELQPRRHEKDFIVPGRLTPGRLAGYLGDWATADHRRNARTAVVFHAGDIPPGTPAVIATSDAFVRRVETLLPAAPQPHRGHPYWHAAHRAAEEAVERRRRFGARAPFTRSLPDDLPAGDATRARLARARRFYERSVRQGLFQFPWHPAWLDSRREARAVLNAMREAAGLVVAERATSGSDWAARRAGPAWRFITPAMLGAGIPDGGPFTACLLYLSNLELSSLPDMLRRIRPHLAADARAVIVIGDEWPSDPRTAIAHDVAGFEVERIEVVRSAMPSAAGRAWMRIVRRASMTVSPARWAWAAVRLAVLAMAVLVTNVIRLIVPGAFRTVSSVLVTFRRAGAAGGEPHARG